MVVAAAVPEAAGARAEVVAAVRLARALRQPRVRLPLPVLPVPATVQPQPQHRPFEAGDRARAAALSASTSSSSRGGGLLGVRRLHGVAGGGEIGRAHV